MSAWVHEARIMKRPSRVNEYFDVGRKVRQRSYTNQFIKPTALGRKYDVPADRRPTSLAVFLTASRSVTALDNVSFDIQAGNFVAIVGRAARTKARLKIISGLSRRPTARSRWPAIRSKVR